MYADIGAAGTDDKIVIWQSSNRAGTTFALSTETRHSLEQRFGTKLAIAPRIFIAHAEHGGASSRLRGKLARQLIALLTGLDDDTVRQMGEPEFRDAVTEELV